VTSQPIPPHYYLGIISREQRCKYDKAKDYLETAVLLVRKPSNLLRPGIVANQLVETEKRSQHLERAWAKFFKVSRMDWGLASSALRNMTTRFGHYTAEVSPGNRIPKGLDYGFYFHPRNV